MKILLTNDDGPDSPLLRTAIRCVRKLGELKIVVPAEEQSWTGKRMTRFGDIRQTVIEAEGEKVHCFGGSPADCANFGIYHLFDGEKPDIVVSGVNTGKNSGLGYVLSSGTVGATLEANIAGITGVALSQELAREVFQAWIANRGFPESVGERLDAQLEEFIPSVFGMLDARPDFPGDPVTWNCNFPYQPSQDCQLKRTAIGHNFYGSYFEGKDGIYTHSKSMYQQDIDERQETDGNALKEGHVSISRIDIRDFGQGKGAEK